MLGGGRELVARGAFFSRRILFILFSAFMGLFHDVHSIHCRMQINTSLNVTNPDSPEKKKRNWILDCIVPSHIRSGTISVRTLLMILSTIGEVSTLMAQYVMCMNIYGGSIAAVIYV